MWKACRAQEKVLREMMSDQRKRAERRAAYFAQKVYLTAHTHIIPTPASVCGPGARSEDNGPTNKDLLRHISI